MKKLVLFFTFALLFTKPEAAFAVTGCNCGGDANGNPQCATGWYRDCDNRDSSCGDRWCTHDCTRWSDDYNGCMNVNSCSRGWGSCLWCDRDHWFAISGCSVTCGGGYVLYQNDCGWKTWVYTNCNAATSRACTATFGTC